MESKCEFSSLTIPNDPDYAIAAAGYVVEIAKIIGFEDQDLHAIADGVRQAIAVEIEYSFEPGEKAFIEISCERIPEGLKISLQDKGLPFDNTVGDSPNGVNQTLLKSSFSSQIFRLKKYMQEVLLHNRGPEGKEIILIKHLKNKSIIDYYAACDLEPYAAAPVEIDPIEKKLECTVRRMKPDEAAEVSKTIYKTYGYTYPHDFIYYPEKIIALNESGQLYSAIAVMDGKEVAGHCAIRSWGENPEIAEMVAGVVKPEYRTHGCFAKLTEYLVDRAQSEGLLGVFGQAVTNHIYSQRTGHQSEIRDCAVLLGQLPMTADFRGFLEKPSQKISTVIGFRYLKQPHERTIYPPLHHQNIIRRIYGEMGMTPKIKWLANTPPAVKHRASIFRINVLGTMNFARIFVERYGHNIVIEIKIKLRELCLKKIEVVNLFLNLSDPLTLSFSEQFEKLGFFFAGLLPGGLPKGDALILQYLNNVAINYEAIRLDSEIARQILDHIKRYDPNAV